VSLIEVRDLRKEYIIRKRRRGLAGTMRDLLGSAGEANVAVEDVTFTIEAGETVGYVGPNGAGKSTTIKMLTGILVPTTGSVRVNGLTPWRNRKQNGQNIGVVFGQRTQLWWDLPVTESFDILRYIYRIPAKVYRENVDFFMDVLGICEFQHTPVRLLSLGQRMRAEVASAFLHNPPIVYLDEPTIGLDLVAKERIRQFLELMNRERNLTIILTTHDLADIERICRRLILIDRGRLRYDGPLAAFKQQHGQYRTLVIETEGELPPDAAFPAAEVTKREGKRLWLRFNRETITASQLLLQIAGRYPLKDCSIEEPSIESILRAIYEQPERAAG